jgi:mRNA interferase RelE/StbE
MSYTVKLRPSAKVKLRPSVQKDLEGIPQQDYPIIANAISGLENNPRPLKVKKLADSGLWRVRVRNYRVVYAINDTDKTVVIVRVARRNEDTYKGL